MSVRLVLEDEAQGERRCPIGPRWDFAKKSQCWGFWNADTSELWFCYPDKFTGDMSAGVVISMPSRSLYPFRWATLRCTAAAHLTTTVETPFSEWPVFGDIGITFGEMSQEELITLFGEKGAAVYEEGGSSDAGAAIPCVMESGGNLAGGQYWQQAAARWKQVQRGDHGFNRTSGAVPVDVKIAYTTRGEDRVYDAAKTIALAGSTMQLRTGHRVQCRAFGVRYEWSASVPVVFAGGAFTVVLKGKV